MAAEKIPPHPRNDSIEVISSRSPHRNDSVGEKLALTSAFVKSTKAGRPALSPRRGGIFASPFEASPFRGVRKREAISANHMASWLDMDLKYTPRTCK